jgi:MoaA/NifB/PqqE/SkfB family radical SAM enzyme
MDDASIRAAIEDAGRRGVKITLSGGEPTLHPRVVDYVRLAASVTRYPVQLQSNAIRLNDPTLVSALVDAGLGEAFISLHGTTAELSDAITEAPGTFVRTIIGIDNLHRTTVRLLLNFVICERNMHDLPNMVRLVAERWEGTELTVSFVAPSSDVVPRDRAFIPRYDEALPFVAEAVREGERLGVRVAGFSSMCGIPLCLVPASIEHFFSLEEVPVGFDQGEFVKTSACAECDLRTRCHGLRRGYRDIHGDAEVRPVRVGP